MNIKTMFFPISTLACVMLIPPVFAHDGTVNITGSILAVSCDVSSATQSVDIGSFAATTFTNVGSTSTPKELDIALTNCGTDTKSATVNFTST